MRLALKFTAALTAAVGCVLIVQAALHVGRIERLQERELRDDVAILAGSLSSAAGELWTHAGPDRARAFVERTDERRARTTIRLLAGPEFEGRRASLDAPYVDRRSGPDGWHVVATEPVRANGRVVSAIEIDRRLPGEQSYFESVVWAQVGTTALAAAVSALSAFLLGLWLISRPLRQLSHLAHRVAEGDFTPRSTIKQRDEIGTLSRDLNAMTEQLAASHQKVRAERRARTAALEQLRHLDRLSTVGKLASSMAHELGTPLNVVLGRAMMVESDESVPEAARANAGIIAEQTRRMTDIIRGLLDFSRRKPLVRKRTSVGELLEHAVSLMEPVCDDTGVALAVRGDLAVTADIDAGKALQVLTNLVVNAVYAMPDGGTITLRATKEHVADPRDRHASAGDFVRIDVEDQGVGIAEERLTDIFDAFFTTKREGEGTGLGLSVCHGIVREHGGFIDVQSTVGRGTCFSVYLPEREQT